MCVNSRQDNFVAGQILQPHHHYTSVNRRRSTQGVNCVESGHLNVLTKAKRVSRVFRLLVTYSKTHTEPIMRNPSETLTHLRLTSLDLGF